VTTYQSSLKSGAIFYRQGIAAKIQLFIWFRDESTSIHVNEARRVNYRFGPSSVISHTHDDAA
jgi:hypothetical protein